MSFAFCVSVGVSVRTGPAGVCVCVCVRVCVCVSGPAGEKPQRRLDCLGGGLGSPSCCSASAYTHTHKHTHTHTYLSFLCGSVISSCAYCCTVHIHAQRHSSSSSSLPTIFKKKGREENEK